MSGINDPNRLDQPKRSLIQNSGFRWADDRDVWVNQDTRKFISAEGAEDHTLAQVQAFIDEPSADDWSFLFSRSPAPGVRESLIRQFERRLR